MGPPILEGSGEGMGEMPALEERMLSGCILQQSLEMPGWRTALCTNGRMVAAHWGVHRVVAALSLNVHGAQEGQSTPRLSWLLPILDGLSCP